MGKEERERSGLEERRRKGESGEWEGKRGRMRGVEKGRDKERGEGLEREVG